MLAHLKLDKKTKIILITILSIFIGLVLFNFIKYFIIKRFFSNYVPPAVTISTVTAKKQSWTPRLHSVGNITAINGVEVNSQVAGNIVGIHFKSGQYVHEGDPLVSIDDSIEQATLKSNQATLALREINYNRQLELAKHGATPSSSVDEAKAQLLQAKAEVEKTEASIRHKHIVAPFSGQLGIRQINLGQYITPGQTTIVSLQSKDPLFLDFYLPEQLKKDLTLNQKIIFSLEQNPNFLFEGNINAINSKIDTTTHNIWVQAKIPNCPLQALQDPLHSPLVKVQKRPYDDKLIISCDTAVNNQHKIEEFNFMPGLFTSLEVELPIQQNVIALPSYAISYSLYGDAVFVVDKKPNSNEHVVRKVFIKTGEQRGNFTVVESGLNEGQEVVSSGELKLQNGTPVVIDNSIKLPNIKSVNLNE